MAARIRCEIHNNHGYSCPLRSVFGVYWSDDGADEVGACKQHVGKAILQLQASVNNGHARTFKVRVLPQS